MSRNYCDEPVNLIRDHSHGLPKPLCSARSSPDFGNQKIHPSYPYIFESDLNVNPFGPQLRSGAQENWIGKWCREGIENAALIDFGLSDREISDVLGTALQLVDGQVLYPIQELLGVGDHNKTAVASQSSR